MAKSSMIANGKHIVSDASPLIGLALVDGLAWLPKLFGQVFLPESVKQEVLPGKDAPGEPVPTASKQPIPAMRKFCPVRTLLVNLP